MPRISYVANWADALHPLNAFDGKLPDLDSSFYPENENIDLCEQCFESLQPDFDGLIPEEVPLEFRDLDECAHPPYGGEDYRCAECGIELLDEDN